MADLPRRRTRGQCVVKEEPAVDVPEHDITLELCRVCLISGKGRKLVDIKSVVDIIQGLSGGIGIPDATEQVCEECVGKLRSAWAIRKKVQLTDAIIQTFRNRVANKESTHIFTLDEQVELACHECDQIYKYDDLLEHIASVHGTDHLPTCQFCETLLACQAVSNFDVFKEEFDDESMPTNGDICYAETSGDEYQGDVPIKEDSESDCKETQIKKKSLRRKRKRTKGIKIRYGCSLCEATYIRKEKLKNHLFKIHNITDFPKHHRIIPADEKTPSSTTKKRRSSVRSSLKISEYSCNICSASFTKQDLLKTHYHEDHNVAEIIESLPVATPPIDSPGTTNLLNVDQRPYVCHVCYKSYDKRDRLVRHLLDSHQILQMRTIIPHPSAADHIPCVCPICEASYAYPKTLRRHMRTNHNIDKPPPIITKPRFVCPSCPATFSALALCDKHLLEHTPFPFHCSICDLGLAHRGERKNHEIHCVMLDATKNIHWQCIPCGQSVSNGAEMKAHRLAAHPNEIDDSNATIAYNCNLCYQSFEQTQSVLDHLDGHGSVVCRVCEKTYPNTHRLKLHFNREHNFQTSIVCTECGKKLSRPDKLLEHMWTHTGFACNVCKITFATRKEAQQHRKENHLRSSNSKDEVGEELVEVIPTTDISF